MSNQSVYVHGNNVKLTYPGGDGFSPYTPGHSMHQVYDDIQNSFIPWTDIVGLPTHEGMKFSGNENSVNTFVAVIPTPVIIGGDRAKLTRIGIKFSAVGANITGIRFSDGARHYAYPFSAMSLGGDHKFSWDRNINYFDLPTQYLVESCICIFFDVSFQRFGSILFCCVGCDFVY